MEHSKTLKFADPDRFLLSLFITDKKCRHRIICLNAVNVELSRIRESVTTPHMGLIRLQWWKDEIKKIYEGKVVTSHPLLIDLSEIIQAHQLPQDIFDQLISAREEEFLEGEAFDLRHYARSIHAPLLELAALILDEKEDVSALAESYAVTGIVRALPYFQSLLNANGQGVALSPQVLSVLCKDARELLNKDRSKNPYFKAHHHLTRLYLDQLEKSGFQPDRIPPLPFKEFRLWWATKFSSS